jgi:molecular chaperone DnaK
MNTNRLLDGEIAVAEISYSTNHNYFIELKDDYDKIIEKQLPLPCNVLRNYKTTINNQKVVKVGIYADVEDGEKEKQTMGFFTIEEDLPQVVILFWISLWALMKYLKSRLTLRATNQKAKSIVLARGNKDSKTLDFLSSSLEKILSSDYTEAQRDYFFKSAKKEIEQINNLGIDNHDSEKWDEMAQLFSQLMKSR